MSGDEAPSRNTRSNWLTRRQDLIIAGSFFAVVFGGAMGYELSTRGLLTPPLLAVLVVLSVLGGALFAAGYWYLYLRRHRL